MNQHRRRAVRAAAAMALLAGGGAMALLSGCATFAGPRDYEVPLSKLQRNIDQRFPLEQRALGLFRAGRKAGLRRPVFYRFYGRCVLISTTL